MTRLIRMLGGAALVLAALLASGAPAGATLLDVQRGPQLASVDDFTIDSFDADYTLGRDQDGRSTLRTVERIVARFPDFDQNRGLIRDLTRVYDGHGTDLRIVSVTDERGEPRAYTTKENGDFLSVTMAVPVGSYVHGAQTYVIEYAQRDVTKRFADTRADEFYWDVNGTGWQQPFGGVSARVVLEDDLAAATTGEQACYRGRHGSTQPCAIARDGSAFRIDEAELWPQETVTFSIGFAEGTFSERPFSLFERIPPLRRRRDPPRRLVGDLRPPRGAQRPRRDRAVRAGAGGRCGDGSATRGRAVTRDDRDAARSRRARQDPAAERWGRRTLRRDPDR